MARALPVEVADAGLAEKLTQNMEQVEEHLLAAVATENELLATSARHLISAGGKRLRPFLVLLGAQFGSEPDLGPILSAAVSMELTHIGTLYHDDIMDEATIRRGVPSAHALWGSSVAVLTGDFLFARASQLIAELGQSAIELHARTFMRLCEGQSAETAGPQSDSDRLNHHIGVLSDKTASLFSASGELGSMLAGAPGDVTVRIGRACEAWGVAYQLSDDVLDVTSAAGESGKPPGADLREGVPTLPMIYVLRSSLPSDQRLVELLRSGQLTDPALHAEALSLLQEHPAIDMARAEVQKWANIARREIRDLPSSPARDVFEALCDFVVTKTL
ncbi:polyprenyl synthetase family protein [Streptomyces sp. FXJ1.172]|uniref:polyprenyl synthetase family protein n=1 Tax=Streptomyces sp. FXJ1.172 TaxID=710705 RepID=UPI000ADE6F67|nr:polyprenyl synthetase family protein [Streptomyces sp. FXJ1.172]WEO95430.1 polyprenyl synthetase family protein [Streptomyces sp. FXJ1.172]